MPHQISRAHALPGGPEPAFVGTKELLIERALARLRSIPDPLSQYAYLAGLRSRNADVFYGLVGGNMKECTVRPGSFLRRLRSEAATRRRTRLSAETLKAPRAAAQERATSPVDERDGVNTRRRRTR